MPIALLMYACLRIASIMNANQQYQRVAMMDLAQDIHSVVGVCHHGGMMMVMAMVPHMLMGARMMYVCMHSHVGVFLIVHPCPAGIPRIALVQTIGKLVIAHMIGFLGVVLPITNVMMGMRAHWTIVMP
jgi:hypothetical protein